MTVTLMSPCKLLSTCRKQAKGKKRKTWNIHCPHDRRNYNNIHCGEPQMAKSIMVCINFTENPTKKMDSRKMQWQKTLRQCFLTKQQKNKGKWGSWFQLHQFLEGDTMLFWNIAHDIKGILWIFLTTNVLRSESLNCVHVLNQHGYNVGGKACK